MKYCQSRSISTSPFVSRDNESTRVPLSFCNFANLAFARPTVILIMAEQGEDFEVALYLRAHFTTVWSTRYFHQEASLLILYASCLFTTTRATLPMLRLAVKLAVKEGSHPGFRFFLLLAERSRERLTDNVPPSLIQISLSLQVF